MSSSDQLHDELAKLLGLEGLRCTPGRRRIVDAIAAAGRPVTIPELLEPSVQLVPSSLYRNLALLERVGVLARLDGLDDRTRYDLGEALTHRTPQHLICATCGPVGEFELADRIESVLRIALNRVALATRFHIDARRFDLLGSCTSCP